jgi:hypothetical protein
MSDGITPFPGRPPVKVGRQVYEVVEPAALLDVIHEVARHIYGQAEVPIEIRHRRFAQVVAAAAVNALQDS